MPAQPLADQLGKALQVFQLVQVAIHVVPVYAHIFMDKNVPQPGAGSQPARERRRQDAQVSHTQNGVVVIGRFEGALQGDDPVADVNTALGGYLEVALYDIAQVGIAVKVGPRPFG